MLEVSFLCFMQSYVGTLLGVKGPGIHAWSASKTSWENTSEQDTTACAHREAMGQGKEPEAQIENAETSM